ncbi:MAG: TetR/AcrR family transcriptional regulator [Syntrophobacteraceae bacterium]|nr:TetR/AcrR family transcriptional regulator [Syntrophobacteraceae bacterium]
MGATERRKREREVRRESAIEAAMALYDEEGYHALTMEKIAERSELSRAALYLYFKNKDEILISGILSHAEYFEGLLRKLYDNRETFRENLLENLWGCFENFFAKDPAAFTAWQYLHQREMLSNLAPQLRALLFEAGVKVVRLQHRIVEYAVEQKIFIQCDHRALSEVIWSTFLGIVYAERSKNVLSHKDHMAITRDTARKVLAQGVLHPIDAPDQAGDNDERL